MSHNTEINFKPLNEGLGFHPYSEGMPYTPATPRPSRGRTPVPQTGSGAVSAGTVSFAKAIPNIAPGLVFTPAPTTAPAPTVSEFTFAYLLRRTLAFALDTVANVALCTLAMGGALWRQNLHTEALITPGLVAAWVLFTLFFSWAVVTAQEIALGTSLGKRIFRLEVPGGASSLLIRAVFFIPGALFCGTGILWALFDRDRRCWHDIAAGTQPENIKRPSGK